MPAISTIADIVTLTLPTFDKNKWDSVGLAQLYPEYEFVKQFVIGSKRVSDSSFLIDTALEIGAPTSYEHTYTNHPAQTAAHQLARRIQTPLVKSRTSMTFSEDEKEVITKAYGVFREIVKGPLRPLPRTVVARDSCQELEMMFDFLEPKTLEEGRK